MPAKKSVKPSSELDRFLERYPDTRSMELLIADMHGILKGKRIPARDFEKSLSSGFPFCGGTVLLSGLGETVSGIPYGADDGDPDVPCRMVPGSIVPIPWSKTPMAQAFFRMYHEDGQPFFADSRAILERAIEPLRKMGLTIVMATELEFYLLDGASDTPRAGVPHIPGSRRLQPGAQVYHPDDLWQLEAFMNDVYAYCEAQSIPADSAISEYSQGQFEINVTHVPDPVLACDHAVLLKRVVKAAARKHGLVACFMAKPFADTAGSGLHIHLSLVGKDGRNWFSEGKKALAAPPFSARLRHAVGGLIETMPEATAIFAPNANSYRRMRPEMYAPVEPNWGVNHRAVAIRIPLADPANLRIEHRTAGADANPYLVAAAVAAGIHHGLTHECDPGEMIAQGTNVTLETRIPDRWRVAIDRLAASTVLPRYLGERYIECFVRNRRNDERAFHNTISALDFDWYLRSA